jgi:hypothetical protein
MLYTSPNIDQQFFEIVAGENMRFIVNYYTVVIY